VSVKVDGSKVRIFPSKGEARRGAVSIAILAATAEAAGLELLIEVVPR
jgi:hypothetical protein